MIDPRAGDPLYIAGPEPVIRERPRWPLILAIVVVIVAVFVVQIAASRREPGPASAAPTLSGTLHGARDSSLARAAGRPRSETRFESVGSVPPLPDTATVLRGTATWYCGRGSACTRGYGPLSMTAAIDPTTGIRKGERLRVTSGGRSITVTVRDVCACAGRRLIDLTSGAFSQLAPLSRGVIPVTIGRVSARSLPVLPATDTVLHGESE